MSTVVMYNLKARNTLITLLLLNWQIPNSGYKKTSNLKPAKKGLRCQCTDLSFSFFSFLTFSCTLVWGDFAFIVFYYLCCHVYWSLFTRGEENININVAALND